MFQALCIRRNVRIKYERFAHAMTAAAVYNVNRSSDDQPVLTAFDFIRESNPDREHVKEIKRVIKGVVAAIPAGSGREKYKEIRARTIASLKAQGREDAEELFDSCWPTLKD